MGVTTFISGLIAPFFHRSPTPPRRFRAGGFPVTHQRPPPRRLSVLNVTIPKKPGLTLRMQATPHSFESTYAPELGAILLLFFRFESSNAGTGFSEGANGFFCVAEFM